ncbi:MAG TPA: tRNA lysidine(34) synthetase TilS [Kofleriaceae bacterium]|jgi:tRNA(Ile)-lysidine synthase|nr:tRNA lysidine(34) synthetase TilS [Kofleriaceae bacterium]
MTTTGPVDPVIAAVNAQIGRVGPGLYGVACSGGADSMALADAAIRAAGAAHVVVLVVDHGLSPGAAEVAQAVAGWARGEGAAAVVRPVRVLRRGSLEAAAREARYAALDALADELGLACVLVGHTARDQAETVLLRVLRGTGPAGLAAIPAQRGRFVRPLLALDRRAIDAYVAARGLPVWHDPMNDDRRLARVRVRCDILPLLRRENPQLDAALVRLASSAAEWQGVIDELARPFARFPIDAAALAGRPAAVRKRALALALEAAGLDYDAPHLDRLDRLIAAPERGEIAIDLPGGAVVRTYGVVSVTVSGDERSGPTPRALEAPHAGYELRTWRPGDRMRPARLKGRSRKLSDLYIDAKVPRAARRVARVLVRSSDAAIVWAEHLGLAHGESHAIAPLPARSDGKF